MMTSSIPVWDLRDLYLDPGLREDHSIVKLDQRKPDPKF